MTKYEILDEKLRIFTIGSLCLFALYKIIQDFL